MELLQDYEFNSPGQASPVLLARSDNGRMAWKDAQGGTLGETPHQTA